MTTMHEHIDELLAADLHEQLSETERNELHAHLVECADCRQLHKEHQLMNTMLDETFEEAKPDLKFEQRTLAAFRDRVPDRGPGVMRFLVLAMRSRAVKGLGIAAALLVLLATGVWLTPTSSFLGVPTEAQLRSKFVQDQSLDGLRSRLGLEETFLRNAQDGRAASEGRLNGPPTNAATDATPPMRAPGFADRLAKAAAGSAAGTQMAAPPPPASVAQNQAAPRDAELRAKRAADDQKKDTSAATESIESVIDAAAERPASPAPAAVPDNRKLVRNAEVELEVRSFDEAVQKITGFAGEDRGYVATTNSEKQENGKLRGQIVVKVLPENLDRFLAKLRGLGELKNQSLTTEDVTKQYFDTDSRLKTARAMEERLLDILKRKSQDINDLLAVEKELGRVREQIEQMQGELKFMDAQVAFATVTIQLAEKDMNEPAAFLLKERAQLALFAPEVEKIYNDIKALASPKVQITSATLDRDNSGRVSARISLLIAPEESEAVVGKTKAMGRVENFQVQTERVARGGQGMSESAKTERDKVELNITISREEQEQSLQQTSLRIRTGEVNDRTKQLRDLAQKQGGRIRSSSFSRDADGHEFANVSLRVPMKNYGALMKSLDSLGRVENVSVTRQDRPDAQIDEQNAPADVSIQVYSQGNIVSHNTGLFATLRRTIGQGVAALMWSVRMIGVALAFLAPWVLALAGVIWLVRRIKRARQKL